MSIRSSKEHILEVLNAVGSGEIKGMPFAGVEYDSRNIKGGELFIALKGEKAHGHEYLSQVFERGAALALVEDKSLLDTFTEKDRLVYVPDTLDGFWRLAHWWRNKTGVPVVAVTGSVGKTTTKELMASILLQYSSGNYALKSFNNHVGVPYSLCRTSIEHGWSVIEIGMNHPGEISKLSKIVEPDVAIITEVSPAHIGAFKGIEGIALEKLSIIDGLRKGGTLVVNGDNSDLAAQLKVRSMEDLKIVKAGAKKDALDYNVHSIESEGFEAISFQLTNLGIDESIKLKISGRHNALNALIAAVACHTLLPDLKPEQIAKGLENFTAPLMRLNLKRISDSRHVLDDSYNANPASMKAILEIARDGKKNGVKIGLVLGDMLELGEFSEKYHRELGEAVANLQPAFLIAVGQMASTVTSPAKSAGVRVFEVSDAEKAYEIAVKEPCDMIFVKGSRGIGLDKTVTKLVQQFEEELRQQQNQK